MNVFEHNNSTNPHFVITEYFITNIVISILYAFVILFSTTLLFRMYLLKKIASSTISRRLSFKKVAGNVATISPTVDDTTVENFIFISDKVLFSSLLILLGLVRIVQLLIFSLVPFFTQFHSLSLSVSSLPAAIYVSCQLLLVFMFAEVFHNRKDELRFRSLKPLFIFLNLFLFSILAVGIISLLVQFFVYDLEFINEEAIRTEFTIPEIIFISYICLLFTSCFLLFSTYGFAITVKFLKMSRSNSVACKQALRIMCLSSFFALVSLGKAVILLITIIIPSLTYMWVILGIYYVLFEIVPILLLLILLYTTTAQQFEVLERSIETIPILFATAEHETSQNHYNQSSVSVKHSKTKDIPVNLLHLSGYSSNTPSASFQTNAASTAITTHHNLYPGANQEDSMEEEPSSWMETENTQSLQPTRTKSSTPRIQFGSSKLPSLLTYSPGSTQYTTKLDYKDFTEEEDISDEEEDEPSPTE